MYLFDQAQQRSKAQQGETHRGGWERPPVRSVSSVRPVSEICSKTANTNTNADSQGARVIYIYRSFEQLGSAS